MHLFMNQLGQVFSVISFGESHGPGVGCVIQGCPAGLNIDWQSVQYQVNRRKTGKHGFASARQEADHVQVLSGIYEGVSLGSPIALLIKNNDARSTDYDHLKNVFRPGHADFTYQEKYGIRDHRGGGRSSIRVTAPMVAAGAIAWQFLQTVAPIQIRAFVSQIGPIISTIQDADPASIEASPVRCPDKEATENMLAAIEACQQEGNTLGGQIRCVIQGVPAGWGEPLFGKLQALLGHAMLSINTVKGVSFGEGFAAAAQTGLEHNDRFKMQESRIVTELNKAGGLLGGISTGENITFNVAFKPISSIRIPQETIDEHGQKQSIEINGRHDVCAVPRAVPIVEAYTAIVLADLYLQHKQQLR